MSVGAYISTFLPRSVANILGTRVAASITGVNILFTIISTFILSIVTITLG
jgi:hypothetical protein